MKDFRFRAAAVLDLRREQFQVAQAELARIRNHRDAAVSRVREADDAVCFAERDFQQVLAAGGAPGVFERHRNWIFRQRADADACRRRLVEWQAAIDRAVADLQESHRQVQVLERLRDRMKHQHDLESRRLEVIEVNELAIMRFARGLRRGGIER
jgi:flagellar export protein FliJ